MARRSDSRPTVEIPRQVDDDPAWTRVGIVAALGLVIGVAWPQLTQTRLAPKPPSASTAQASANREAPVAATSHPPAPPRPTASALPVAQPSASANPAPAARAELATIVVRAANVRAEPKSKNVTGRLVEGTKVQILARNGSWFRVRYGKDMAQEGWIFREAIGR